MNAANDNDTIPKQQAVNDLFDTQGDALLRGLYARKLLALRHEVDRECAARGRDFETLDKTRYKEQDEDQRMYLMSIFRDAALVDAFETVAEYHNSAIHFWNMLAVEYFDGRNDANANAIEQARGELVVLLGELGGVGTHEAEELVRRNEGQIRKAIQSVVPNYQAIRSY